MSAPGIGLGPLTLWLAWPAASQSAVPGADISPCSHRRLNTGATALDGIGELRHWAAIHLNMTLAGEGEKHCGHDLIFFSAR